MSPIQLAFAVGLTGVLVAVAAFAAVVARAAVRSGGGSHPTRRLAARMLRSPEERAELSRWAFYLHRVSGVAIFGFLCLHVLDVGVYSLSRSLYDELHTVYGSAPMRVFECGLLFAILFHTFNGLRILAIDFGDLGLAPAGRLLAAVVAATVLLGIAGSAVILAPVLA